LRQGLASMQERACAIGARLSLESRPGRTVVAIALSERAG
jgi:signal transduction histidine kinase